MQEIQNHVEVFLATFVTCKMFQLASKVVTPTLIDGVGVRDAPLEMT